MMRRVCIIALMLFGAGCEVASGTFNPLECFSIKDCPADLVCFLGACVEPNFNFTSVYAELTPPASSSYLEQAYPGSVDVSQGILDMQLRGAVQITGKVLTDSASPDTTDSQTGMLKASAPSTIPGHDVVQQAAVSASGFTLTVVPGIYDLTFTPNQGGPPYELPAQSLESDNTLYVPYPDRSSWVQVRGRVRFTPDIPTPVDGATVTGTATGAGGTNLRSSDALTNSIGEYLLEFPPGAEVFCVSIGPGTNLMVPETQKCGLTLASPDGYVDDIFLGVSSAHVTVNATVMDTTGERVGRASVVFDGSVGEGHFTTSGSTTDDGGVQSLLWPGDYMVTVAPYRTDPWALSTAPVTITSDQPVTLYVGNKVALSGTVYAFDGSPVSGAIVTVSRRGVALQREFSITTASDGTYSLAIDPGDATADAEYELTVQPDLTSRLPYFRELLRVGVTETQHDVRLYDATLAAGRVCDPGGTPLADVVIAFYSVDLGTPQQPFLVGVGRTNELGEFVVPLPQLQQP